MFDFTSWWVFWQKNEKRVRLGLLGALLFFGGWQAGRIMSPYYVSHPIVFEDRQCSACASSGGDTAALEELAQPEPAVASTVDVAGEFVASINSDLYHHASCSSAKRINPENQVHFGSTADAKAAGYSPSKCTQDYLTTVNVE